MNPAVPSPTRAVWELTWRCNLRCSHCLVEGGPNDKVELDTTEGLALIDALVDLGVRRLTLTGGEPLMRRDWEQLARHARARGLTLLLSTNGLALSGPRLAAAAELGMIVVISVDGLRETHDRGRPFPEARAARSSYDETEAAIGRARAAGLDVIVITTVDRHNLDELPAVQVRMAELGVWRWTVQLGHATGRLAAEDMLPSTRMPELARFLVRASRHPTVPPVVHHTIGWLSRDEPVLRSSGDDTRLAVWGGTPCGASVIAVEPDGGVKGCPNQVGAPFVVGNVREEPLARIWADRARWFWVDPPAALAQGACAPCGLKARCGGGCPCVAWATTGHIYDNPRCLRAIERMEAAP